MTDHPNVDRSIKAWLIAEAPERASERLLDASRERIQTTRQRRAWWPAWRFPVMNGYAKLAIGLAAVAVAAIIGFNLLPAGGGSRVGGPAASPSASPKPSPTRTPADVWPSGQLPEGQRQDASQYGIPFSFSLPSTSWRSDPPCCTLHTGTYPLPGFAWFLFQQPFKRVSTDPCAGTTEPIGGSLDEQAQAAARIGDTDAVGPTDVTVGGRPAKVVDLTLHDDISCEMTRFWLFGNNTMYPNAIDSRIRIWFVDVDGSRILEFHTDQVGPDPTVASEIQQIVDSIQFE